MQAKRTMPIQRPEYEGMRRRLAKWIRGANVDCNTHIEYDGIRGKRESTIEAQLTPDLRYLGQI
jgi:hypothetical protein